MAGKSRRLTTRIVEALKPGEIVWDADVKGFGCRRQRREFVYILKTRVSGRQRWYVIGPHGSPWTTASARKEALRLLGQIASGMDPAVARSRAGGTPTVAVLARAFLDEHVSPKLKPSTAAHYRNLIKPYLIPALGKLRVDQVSQTDVARLHHSLRTTPYQANRLLAVCSKMFSWAERQGMREKGANPCIGLERFREKSRERWLSDDELARLGAALIKAEREGFASPHAVAAFRLLLLTGTRLGEILNLRWEDVDLDRGILNLPDSKTGAKIVGLNEPAMAVLRSIPRVADNPHVIVGQIAGRPLVNPAKPWQRIRALADLDDLRLHDLRHNYGSHAASTGASLPLIAKQMGHTQLTTTGRYAHALPAAVQEMNDAVGNRLAALMDSSSSATGDNAEGENA